MIYVPVDPNRADAETLMQIPGVDRELAVDLTDARPFATGAAFMAALSAHLELTEEDTAHTRAMLTGD